MNLELIWAQKLILLDEIDVCGYYSEERDFFLGPILDMYAIFKSFIIQIKKVTPIFLLQIPVLKFPENIHDQTHKERIL